MSADRDALNHIRRCQAQRRYNKLIDDIDQRVHELGLTFEQKCAVMRAAEREVWRRGMHPDQYPHGDPEAAYDLYGW